MNRRVEVVITGDELPRPPLQEGSPQGSQSFDSEAALRSIIPEQLQPESLPKKISDYGSVGAHIASEGAFEVTEGMGLLGTLSIAATVACLALTWYEVFEGIARAMWEPNRIAAAKAFSFAVVGTAKCFPNPHDYPEREMWMAGTPAGTAARETWDATLDSTTRALTNQVVDFELTQFMRFLAHLDNTMALNIVYHAVAPDAPDAGSLRW